MNIVSNYKYDEMYGDGYHEPDLTNKQIREYFHGRCPYTDKPCDNFDCPNCEVEKEEEKYLEEDYYNG